MTADPLTFRHRILAGETLIGTFLNLGSPAASEVCARAGLDWVVIDLEHGTTTEAGLEANLLAVRGTGAAPLVRVEQGTRLRVGRALDLGAAGVVVPQVSSEAEARDLASWLRFPPAGRRGVALFTRGLDWGIGGHGAVGPANDEIVGIAQVESRAAVEAADAIASVDGVDVLFVGPADLSHALGVPGQIDHDEYRMAIERVANAARSHDKACGVLVWKPEDATRYADLGFTIFSVSTDGGLLDRAVRDEAAATREAIGRAAG